MARRSGSSGGSGMSAGPMNTIIAGFVGLLVIVAIVILGPILAGSIDDAVPYVGTCSYTNTSEPIDFTEYGRCGDTNVSQGRVTGTFTDAEDAAAEWNTISNPDLPTGESLWSTNVVIGGVVILVFFIALAIYYIRVIA